MDRRRLMLVSGGVVIAGAFGSWYLSKRSGTIGTTGRWNASLRLKWLYDPGFAGEMVAARLGFFEDEGIGLRINSGGFEADPIRLVSSGADQIGVAGADTFLQAVTNGIPLVAFAAGYITSPVVFYVRAESDITRPEDFVGKTVGVQSGQDTALIYEALVETAGVDRSLINEVSIKFDFTPFLAGRVDVWPGYAATQSYILETEGIDYRTIKPQDFGINFPGTVFFTMSETAENRAHELRKIRSAISRGWEYVYQNQIEAAQVINAYDPTNLPIPLILANFETQRSFIRPEGHEFCEIDLENFEQMASTMKRLNLIQSDAIVDFNNLILA